ncbi:MAG: MBL fold metallo-hydrolase [Bacteroidetes bacterium CHB5]|nr:MBL fold metallo-hydrolase [Bacteroidetes bacterium CHB5]
MNLHVINTGFFKLDGGAMFGVVPKSIWQKTNPPDERNLCNWAMRCLLIESGNTLMLIDNGLGNKQDEKFFSHYYLNGTDTLEGSLKQAGFSTNDVTDMFLSHLHFDHCGGGIKRAGDKLVTTFARAIYWSNEAHWQWATQPNAREKASFLKENILPIQESGQLRFIHEKDQRSNPFGFMDIFYASGHTDKMMIPKIRFKNHTICFMADLLPSVGHIPLPYVMGYDTRPLLTLEEKAAFLNEAADNNYILFLEHDPQHECCTVKHTEKGVRLDKTFSLKEIQ